LTYPHNLLFFTYSKLKPGGRRHGPFLFYGNRFIKRLEAGSRKAPAVVLVRESSRRFSFLKGAIMKTADEIRAEFWKNLSIDEGYALLEKIARLRKAGVDVERVLDEIAGIK
jgi:hypothetical protein